MLIENREFLFPPDKKIMIRSADRNDAESLCRHRCITAGETHYMARYPEECKTDIEKMRDDIKNFKDSPINFLVTAFYQDTVIGDLGITQISPHIKSRHRAYMGISIQEQYCNSGLGKAMIEIAIAQTKANGFEQLELCVYADNTRAIHLYEKFGFQQYGIQPRAFKLKDGTYHDEIIMTKML